MLQNAKATAFTVSELLMENQQEGRGGGINPTQIRVKHCKIVLFHSVVLIFMRTKFRKIVKCFMDQFLQMKNFHVDKSLCIKDFIKS